MRVTVLFRDVKGWPRMFVENAVPEKGDSVRLANWGLNRVNDLKAVAAEHARLTEEAKGGRRSVATLRELFRKALEEPQQL